MIDRLDASDGEELLDLFRCRLPRRAAELGRDPAGQGRRVATVGGLLQLRPHAGVAASTLSPLARAVRAAVDALLFKAMVKTDATTDFHLTPPEVGRGA